MTNSSSLSAKDVPCDPMGDVYAGVWYQGNCYNAHDNIINTDPNQPDSVHGTNDWCYASPSYLDGQDLVGSYGEYQIQDDSSNPLIDTNLTGDTYSCGNGDCLATFNTTISDNGALIDGVQFLQVLDNGSQVNSSIWNYQFYYLQNVSSVQCLDNGTDMGNGTDYCSDQSVYNSQWTPFSVGDNFPNGNYQVELTGSKNNALTYDWQVNLRGVWTSNWATWGNISTGATAQSFLNYPTNNLIVNSSLVQYNSSANITNGAYLVNTSLYTNETGSWSMINSSNSLAQSAIPTIFSQYYLNGNSNSVQNPSYNGVDTSVTYSSSGRNANQSAWFNGASSHIILTNLAAGMNGASNWSYFGWININTSSGTNQIFKQGQYTNGQGMGIEVVNGHLEFYSAYNPGNSICDTNGIYEDISGGIAFTPHTWYSVAIVQNNTGNYAWINGVFTQKLTCSATGGSYSNSDLGILMGYDNCGRCGSPAHCLNGSLQNIYLFNGISLNQTQINTLAGTGLNYSNQLWNNTYSTPGTTIKWNEQWCDSQGACGFAPQNFTFSEAPFLVSSETYNANTYSLANENYIINFSYDSVNYPSISGNFVYNNISYPVALAPNGNSFVFNQTIPAVNVSTNNTFYWSITLGGTLVENTTSHIQTVNPLSIDNCAVNSIKILNLTLYDEDTNTALSTNSSILNSTINAQVRISNAANPLNYVQYNHVFTNTQPAYICIQNNTINQSSYRMDVVVSYTANNYVSRFYYLQNYNLNSLTAPVNRTLYDLLSSESTTFTVNYNNANFIPVQGAVIELYKNFIGLGTTKPIEDTLTDNYGTGTFHIETLNTTGTYAIGVFLNGALTSYYQSITPTCTDILTGQCYINLNALTATQFVDWNTWQNLNYAYNFSESSRNLQLNWQIQNLSSGTANITQIVVLDDAIGNTTICTISNIGSVGTYNCNINASLGNTSIISYLYDNGQFVDQQPFYFSSNAQNTFGNTGIIMAFVFVVSIALMFTSSPIGVIIGAVVGLFMVGGLAILNITNPSTGNMVITVGGIITAILVVAGILIYKMNNNGNGGGF